MKDLPLFIFPHLGLGDAIICNGLVRVLAEKHSRLVWFARADYAEPIGLMYSDLPNVIVVPVKDDEEVALWLDSIDPLRCLCLGYRSSDFDPTKFDAEFYRQAGVDFEDRWKRFALPPSAGVSFQSDEKIGVLVHDAPERGMTITSERLRQLTNDTALRVTTDRRLWDWLPVLLSSREFHCIDSAFLNLAESLYALGFLRKTRLVLHAYAKQPANLPTVRAPWEILKE